MSDLDIVLTEIKQMKSTLEIHGGALEKLAEATNKMSVQNEQITSLQGQTNGQSRRAQNRDKRGCFDPEDAQYRDQHHDQDDPFHDRGHEIAKRIVDFLVGIHLAADEATDHAGDDPADDQNDKHLDRVHYERRIGAH